MIPTGDFFRLKNDILSRYENDEVTFGILIADPRQNETREYIYNYLSVFHDESGKLFDFFIPGYEKVIYRGKPYKLDVYHETTSSRVINEHTFRMVSNNIEFQFNRRLFDEFCSKLKENFGIQYTFNPMLILMSMKPGYIHTAKYIVIELDDNEWHSVRRSGVFFIDLFNIFRTDTSLEYIQNHMKSTYAKGNLINTIINSIGKSWLVEVKKYGDEIKRYRIRKNIE